MMHADALPPSACTAITHTWKARINAPGLHFAPGAPLQGSVLTCSPTNQFTHVKTSLLFTAPRAPIRCRQMNRPIRSS
eukprot:scaffold219019_cov22-Tisochrysis_lutea.AAC.1